MRIYVDVRVLTVYNSNISSRCFFGLDGDTSRQPVEEQALWLAAHVNIHEIADNQLVEIVCRYLGTQRVEVGCDGRDRLRAITSLEDQIQSAKLSNRKNRLRALNVTANQLQEQVEVCFDEML
jgi:hypothetical protein